MVKKQCNQDTCNLQHILVIQYEYSINTLKTTLQATFVVSSHILPTLLVYIEAQVKNRMSRVVVVE